VGKGTPQNAVWRPPRNHVVLVRDIAGPIPHTGERGLNRVEPIGGSDALLRHVSCEARAAPSLTRINSTLAVLNLLNSLSIWSGGAIVVVSSLVIALVIAQIGDRTLRSVAIIFSSFALAYSLYWSPVWLGASDQARYAAWAWLFIVPWFAAGALASTLCVYLLRFVVLKHRNNALANQSTDPTLSSGTPRAGHEPRHR
jgi:hypothetical protein